MESQDQTQNGVVGAIGSTDSLNPTPTPDVTATLEKSDSLDVVGEGDPRLTILRDPANDPEPTAGIALLDEEPVVEEEPTEDFGKKEYSAEELKKAAERCVAQLGKRDAERFHSALETAINAPVKSVPKIAAERTEVMATRPGEHGGRRYEIGQKFYVEEGQPIGSWMQVLTTG